MSRQRERNSLGYVCLFPCWMRFAPVTNRSEDEQAKLSQEISLFSSANVKRGYAIRPEDIPSDIVPGVSR